MSSIDAIEFFRFAAGFVLLWLFISAVISLVGGWSKLASQYRSGAPMDGHDWGLQSAFMRYGTRYKNVVRIITNENGLSLSMLVVFRVGHPPLFIPWSELNKIDGGLRSGHERLVTRKLPSVFLALPAGLVREIEDRRGIPIASTQQE